MSISDIFLNLIIWIINNSILKLPGSISVLPLQTLQTNLASFLTTLQNAFAFIDNFIPLGLLFGLLGAIIVAEIAQHLGWKGMKWLINVFRGSGG